MTHTGRRAVQGLSSLDGTARKQLHRCPIRLRPLHLAQLVATEPPDPVVIRARRGRGIRQRRPVAAEVDGPPVHGRCTPVQQLTHTDAHPELLADLPHQSILWRLPRFDLAARELPQPAGLALRVAPAREHKVAARDHGGDDGDDGGHSSSVAERDMLANVLTIDPSLPEPLWEQLRDQLITQINSGELVPGDKLPSVRQLAGDLELAPNTVARVYKELETSGYLQTHGRNGTTVAEDLAGNDTHRRAAELTSDYLGAMATLGFNMERTVAYLQRNAGRRYK